MGMKVSKTAIGAFVLGAIALLVAGVLVLGAGKLFTREHTYITYFDGSVKGLNVGSPVMFRGVKVGSVTNISITVSRAAQQLKIPVIFTMEPAKIKGARVEFQHDPKFIVQQAVIQQGLRTQLQSLSFVTGQLAVSLDFFPGKPAQFVGLTKEYPEIPSVQTPLEALQKTLETLPFKEIVTNLNSTLEGMDTLVRSVDAEKAIRDVQTLLRNLNAKVEPLAESLTDTSGTAEATLAETRETITAARGHMTELAASTKSTLETAQAALKQSQQIMNSYSGDSRLLSELNKTLHELSATSRSLRHLSDYLERHPESLLRGKAD